MPLSASLLPRPRGIRWHLPYPRRRSAPGRPAGVPPHLCRRAACRVGRSAMCTWRPPFAAPLAVLELVQTLRYAARTGRRRPPPLGELLVGQQHRQHPRLRERVPVDQVAPPVRSLRLSPSTRTRSAPRARSSTAASSQRRMRTASLSGLDGTGSPVNGESGAMDIVGFVAGKVDGGSDHVRGLGDSPGRNIARLVF